MMYKLLKSPPGGPGCSSELAVFYENGPWTLDADLNPVETEYGWDRAAHMIYVDQPIGTGFSYSDDDRDRCYDEDCVADDMLDFLEALWAARPDLAGRDFFVTGESYAGHYVPAVSSRVYHAVKNGETQADIRLKGLAIGNGLTAPSIQYGAYADFAADNGLITSDLRDQLNEMYPSCRVALQVCDGLGVAAECLAAVMYCQTVTFAPVSYGKREKRNRPIKRKKMKENVINSICALSHRFAPLFPFQYATDYAA